jgi:uncharacterized membrane protein YdjX (TVP38/TMEM64 family)
MTEKQKKGIAILCVVIFILFCALVGYFVGIPMVRLAEDPAAFQNWVNSYGIWSRVLFIGMVVLQVLIAFIPGEPIELAAGYAFGFWEGSFLTLAGFLIGSWLVFLLVRKFGVNLVEVFFSREKIDSFAFLKNPKKTRAIAFVLMLIPGTPKDFLSYFAGLTHLTLPQWLLIVAIGRVPSLITSTATGAAAGKENYILSVVMLTVTLLLTIAGILYYRYLCKEQSKDAAQQ